MQSRTLLNIALLLFVACLGGYVYYSSQQQAPSQPARLAQLTAGQVTRIDIEHNQRRIELRKDGERWRMLRPIEMNANAFRIDTLLNMLETTSHAAYPASTLDLQKYGLGDSSTSISFNDETIAFGIVNPINGYRYVLSGDTVHLIDDHFYPLVSSQTGTLVARELLDSDADIEKLVLPAHTLYRDETDRWHSDPDMDPDVINETLYHWKNSQAFGVHNYMPRESLGDISVFLSGSPEPVQFQITDTDPWLIIARPDLDIEYHFNLEFYDRLLRPGADTEGPGGNIAPESEAAGENGG
jgi:hypothetical protein